MQAIKDGVARVKLTKDEAFKRAGEGIDYSRSMTKTLMDNDFIKEPPQELLQDALEYAIKQVK
jgi:malate dehydrogenase (oxaloacetate-decarboxylating)